MKASTPFLDNLIQELRAYSQDNVQEQWQGLFEDLGADLTGACHPCGWDVKASNERDHIAWQRGRVLWLYQRFTIPETLYGYSLQGLTLRLSVAWWAEDARIYVNGEWVQSGDLFDFFTRVCLSESVMPGDVFEVALRLESPKHDAGALVRSCLIYEAIDHPVSPEPGFVADELEVLQYYLSALAPERLAAVESLISKQWSVSNGDLQSRLADLRRWLQPHGDWVKQRQIHCVGHAHLDLAWLWPVADTWRAAERTFESVLALQQEFPELTYSHSSPALFAWLERNRPDLFARIQHQVAAGKWSIDAGLWVEPELNIAGGEAIARQILYGQHYCQEKFGTPSLIAWLPDTFGFCSQLPQLLRLGGVQVFATQKLRWNDTTQFPHELFRWQAPDGSEVLGWTLPPIGTDFDPVSMAKYGAQWEQKTGSAHVCWLPGVGDHGGGPTRDMLLKARRWQQSPLFPQVTFSTPAEFLAQAVGNSAFTELGELGPPAAKSLTPLPLWSDELYLELHRGCYTAHSDQKQQNRRAEDVLYQAEVWATVAHLLTGQPYPKEALEMAWKDLLFNQFHDILPGSSIPEVFKDANQTWTQVLSLGNGVLETALETVAAQVAGASTQGQPVLVFNCHSWSRTDMVELEVAPGHWTVLDGETHQPVESVISASHPDHPRLKFVACDVPPVGYRLYSLVQNEATSVEPLSFPDEFVLENDRLRVCISSETGEIVSCVHQPSGREVFSGAANQLQCFEDSGQYWDAWNIAPDYATKPLPPATLTSIEWIAHSHLCQQLRVTRQLNRSTITQDYVLETQSPVLKVETWVDWQETQVVLKVNFPATVISEQATYEVPFGAIQRSTQPVTDHEKAKWEVPALRWADLSDDRFGVSILTDCKHGFDAQPDQLRLTLLKAPLWPDPECDRGHHHFTYAIYPHAGTWQTAHTPHHAQALNSPLRVHVPQTTNSTDVSASRSFFQLNVETLLLAALKPSETEPDKFIARYYDAYGLATPGSHQAVVNSLGLTLGVPLNLLEEPTTLAPDRPYQIYTCLLEAP